MANEHKLESPEIVAQDGKLIVRLAFYRAGYLTGEVLCTLRVFHDAVELEDDKKLFDQRKIMKRVNPREHLYKTEFSVPLENIGKISLDVELIKSTNSALLAKASYRYGVKLNQLTKIRRDDAPPRLVHAINTAAGRQAKPSTGHKLNDMLAHIHAALIDNDRFRVGMATSIDGAFSGRRQKSSQPLRRVDEQLSAIIAEKFLGLPYQMPGNVYGNCHVPGVTGKRLVHLNNDVFWERMRPSADEITYPWCTECQQLTSMVNYLRGADIYALAPGSRGEMGAQRASFHVATAAGGTIIDEADANGPLPAKLYDDPQFPLGPGDFFVFNDEKHRVKADDGTEQIVTGKVVRGYSEAEREKRDPKPIPAQHPDNHPHISCILRVFKRAGNHFFQLIDTGGQPPFTPFAVMRQTAPTVEGTCEGRFLTLVRADADAAGIAPCVGIGVWPKSYKTDVGKLERAYERALVARPVALARLFLVERATGAVLYATPLLRTYTEDPHQNFSPARLAWALRNVPHGDEIEAFWGVWGPRGPLAKRMIASRNASLFDIRSEFAASTTPSAEFNNVILSKFPYGEATGFLFLQNINALSSQTAEQMHGGEHEFRFPTDDQDPDYYKQFGYVAVTRYNNAHKSKSWIQLKAYDLNAYAWDQHVFGDRSVRKVSKQVTSTDIPQELEMLTGQQRIDAEQFAVVEGKWFSKGTHPASPVFDSGKLGQQPGGPKDGQVAKSANDKAVTLTLPKTVAAIAGDSKVQLWVELSLPVIDQRYPRPDKYEQYPYFRGDFPVRPVGCPGNPGPDACPDFFPDKCPSDCQYIVRLRSLKLGGTGRLDAPFKSGTTSYSGTISYTDGAALTVTANASCKAKVEVACAGKTVSSSSGVESPPLQLGVGSNTVEVTATAQNNTVAAYTLTLTRAQASSDHSLAALTPSAGKLVQAGNAPAGFAPKVLTYELVDTQDAKLGYRPKLTNELAKLQINGKPHASDTEFTLNAAGFGSHVTNFEVRAEDGGSSIYELTYRRGNDNAALKTLRCLINYQDQELVKNIPTEAEQSKHPDKESYSVEVPDATTRVRIVAVPAVNTSKVFLDGKRLFGVTTVQLQQPGGVEGEPPLQTNGASVALIEVEAQNGRRRIYELQIYRPKDKDLLGH
ncbi:cadherin-like beta sandwich domain-containing protein [Enhygromyxa salina]|uniref:Cadherin-like beta sandwich domain protein n=1 Tax=Enhygromyxa salina TaxID=215803 RepID=A0A2S9YM91_9BACT|nr:cadherin-like beta sandwich domain-containing protein [Enhygromyxa salina]PRQ06192.1 Cadherin-like beta sandwich domain protein [Enhygromyxa salina]